MCSPSWKSCAQRRESEFDHVCWGGGGGGCSVLHMCEVDVLCCVYS